MQKDDFLYDKWPIYGEEELKAVQDVVTGRRWGGIFRDSYNERFETEFSKLCGISYATTVSNATVGLFMSLLALGIQPGDEVIVPALSFVATATAVTWCHAVPVFVDAELCSLCMDPEKIESAITPKTKAIIPVHLWGNVCDMPRIQQLAKRYGLYIIEDCCQAVGATLQGKRVGNWSDMAVFSMAYNKSISCGEGGAILTSDPELHRKAHMLRNHGRVESSSNSHDHLGWNFRLSEIGAAIALCQLARLDHTIAIKNKNYDKIRNALRLNGVRWGLPLHFHEEAVPSPFGIALRFKEEECALSFEMVSEKLHSMGIPSGSRKTIPLFMNPIYCTNQYENRNTCSNAYPNVIVIGQPLGYNVLMAEDKLIDHLIDALLSIECMLPQCNKREDV